MEVVALYEGSYSVDISKKFVPFDPAIHQAKDRPGSLFIYVQPFLVKTNSHLILVDTGLGYNDANGNLVLHENIRKAGYDPDDVSMVLMTHLHFDHSGGMVMEQNGQYQVSFPHAEYVIQRGEWENAFSKRSSSYKTEIFESIQRGATIKFVEGNGQLNDTISYEVTGAHTEFHQVFLFEEDGDTYFFGGDILPEPEQLLRKFIAKYDLDGRKAMELREEYGIKAAENNWLCMFYHAKSTAMARVQWVDHSFRIV